jgi:alpha-ketoglutarate-dependent taurine dioxygenase
MKITNIHDKWGSIIEFNNSYDFFDQPLNFWRNLLYQRKLLILKKMNIELIDYAKFGHYFGRPWEYNEYIPSLEEPVEVVEGDKKYSLSVFYNGIHKSNNEIGIHHEMDWHTDIPNHKTHSFPFRAIWAVKKPQNSSGNTHWLNIEDCFDKLNPRLSALLPRVSVLQQNWHKFNTDFRVLDIIKVHPVTKSQSLRLNFYATEDVKNAWIVKVFIDSKPQPDCNLIQEYIDDLLQHKELYFSHTWDVNDIAIYDNHSFLHGRAPVVLHDDSENCERKFYRINIDHMSNEEFQNTVLPPATSTSTIK